jgi:hypothetical protein
MSRIERILKDEIRRLRGIENDAFPCPLRKANHLTFQNPHWNLEAERKAPVVSDAEQLDLSSLETSMGARHRDKYFPLKEETIEHAASMPGFLRNLRSSMIKTTLGLNLTCLVYLNGVWYKYLKTIWFSVHS